MVLEQISEKRIKISAKNADAELPQLFLIHVMFLCNKKCLKIK